METPSGQILLPSWLLCLYYVVKLINWCNSPDVSFLCAPRNLSSVNEKTRQQMRETHGLVDSLVGYVKASLEDNKSEDKVSRGKIKPDLKQLLLNLSLIITVCFNLCVCVSVRRGWRMQCVCWGTSPTSCTVRCRHLLCYVWKDQPELRTLGRGTPLAALHIRAGKPKTYVHVQLVHSRCLCV